MPETKEQEQKPLRERVKGDALIQKHLEWHEAMGQSGLLLEEESGDKAGG